MKKTKNVLMAVFMLLIASTQAQVSIGISAASMDASAQLEVKSTDKGFLPPRMTAVQRNSIITPSAGLVLWCSNCGTSGELQVFNGTAWTNIVGGTAAAVPEPLAVGQSYQGGIIAYIDGTGLHGFIAATEDIGTSWVPWYNGNYLPLPTTGTSIGTGMANTNAIIANLGNTGSYAAKICRDYRGGGYSDWYLPSKNELLQLYVNKAAIGNLINYYYWTSSAYSTNLAWLVDMSGGEMNYNYQDVNSPVRAVRAF